MSQFQRLYLVAAPDTHRTPAFERAAALARASGAVLHIGQFVHNDTIDALSHVDTGKMAEARGEYLAGYEQWLAAQVAMLQEQGVQVSHRVIWSKHPLGDILVQLRDCQTQLLIKDVQPEPAIQRAIATPMDLQLLQLSPVPVHLVTDAQHALPQKVVAAVDPLIHVARASEFNDCIIEAAKALARQCNAELHLLDVSSAMVDQPFSTATLNLPWLGEMERKMKSASREAFQLLAKRHGVADGLHHFLMGAPGRRIAEFVQRIGSDVVVMGSSSRESLGSTIETLLYRMPGSVLIVHPQD